MHEYFGNGLLEKVYESALAHRLEKSGFNVERQKPLKVFDADGFCVGDYFVDILVDGDAYSADLETKMHRTIKKVSSDYENLKFNTAIAAMMSLLNEFYKKNEINKAEYKTLITLLNPVAPHITEELWETKNYGGRLYQATWPEYDEAKTIESTVEIAVQINGKTKVTLNIGKEDPKDEVIAKAKEALGDKLTGTIVKEIYVPGRIVNIVAK